MLIDIYGSNPTLCNTNVNVLLSIFIPYDHLGTEKQEMIVLAFAP